MRRDASVLATTTALSSILASITGADANEPKANEQFLYARIDQLAAVGQKPGTGAVLSADHNKAAGAAAAGNFPRSILIPGTDISIKIYGEVAEVVDYYVTGGPVNSSPWSTTVGINGQLQSIPLNTSGVARARGNGVFGQSPRQSKIGVETRTPTPFGEARTVMEFDWAGSTAFVPGGADPTSVSNNLVPRIRYAYGTLGGLLAGQATSNFSDLDANAETLDIGGNAGVPGRLRVPQVRYTMATWSGSSLSFSAEQPETIIATPVGIEGSDAGVIPTLTTDCTAAAPAFAEAAPGSTCASTLLTSGSTPLNPAKTVAPDFTIAYYIPQTWGHFSLSAVVRPGIEATDGKYFAKHYVGYGGHVGLNFQPGWFGWAKDNFTLHVEGGDTIGPYIKSSSNFDLATNYGAAPTNTLPGTYGGFNGPTSAAAAASIIFKPTQELGAEIGYQHWWTSNLHSNINGGFNAHWGIPVKLVNAAGPTTSSGGQAAAINKELITGHANLIWNAVSSVDIGIEYTWGQRTVLNNSTGTLNALICKLAFRF